jgi:hypothetical protein
VTKGVVISSSENKTCLHTNAWKDASTVGGTKRSDWVASIAQLEIVVMVPVVEDTQEAQQLLQNDNHDDDHEKEENEEEEEEGNEEEDEDDEDYTPLSDFKKEKEYHITDEIKTF